MPQLLSFDEFKVKYASTFGKWKAWPVQEFNIPVVLRWCELNCIGDYCIKIPSWARNRDMTSPNNTANHTILFSKPKDRSRITKDLGQFWVPLHCKTFDGIAPDDSYVWKEECNTKL